MTIPSYMPLVVETLEIPMPMLFLEIVLMTEITERYQAYTQMVLLLELPLILLTGLFLLEFGTQQLMVGM